MRAGKPMGAKERQRLERVAKRLRASCTASERIAGRRHFDHGALPPHALAGERRGYELAVIEHRLETGQ